jgi:competence protein ComEA
MWRSRRWIVLVICVAGLLSGGVGIAQDRAGTPPGASGMAPGKAATVTGPVNLNTADEATLKSSKGVGAVRAKAIIAYRQQNGPFKSVDDLKKVPDIGDKLLAQLKDQVTVGK